MQGFPSFIDALPVPDSPVKMDARIVPSNHILTMFYEIDEDVTVPEHTHGAQWGVVLQGAMSMIIDGVERRYTRGDTYEVPADVPHITKIEAGYRGIDVFADPDRYLARDQQQ